MARKYRIALFVDALEVPKWVHDFARGAEDSAAVDLVALIVAAPAKRTRSLGERLLGGLLNLERRAALKSQTYSSFAKSYSISACAPVLLNERDVVQSDAAEIRRLELDAIVQCSAGFPPPSIAGAAKDGVIWISTGAGRTGFSEVLRGHPETRFSIERLDRSGAKETLFRGSVATALLATWNEIALQTRAFQYLQLTLERLAAGTLPRVPARPGDGANQARLFDPILYAGRTAGRMLGKAVRRYSGKEFNWSVAFTRQSWQESSFQEGIIVPSPPGSFMADPFTIAVDGVHYIFVEEFPYQGRKGVIAAYKLDGDRPERIGVVLEEPYHLSFPFLFRHAGGIYMVPEGGAGRFVKLYKATNFPTEWAEVKVLMADVPAVDTIVFEHEGRWWMFTSIQGDGPGLNNAELHAFHAADPLGEWTPHAANPIVMDAARGRNGGFVRQPDGTPCRVAQVSGFTFYGAGSAVYRIDELTPDTYRETLVKQVEPNFFPDLDGTHHIHSADGLTVYDMMRVERPPAAAPRHR
ncbi:hypothetical protein ACUXST_000239 [Sphingomonas sp. F9_3S_D5_B_2]